MARIVGKNIIGAVGPVVFSEHRGVNTLRAKNGPKAGKQTEQTKNSASLFGDASKFAAQIRYQLEGALHFIPDGEMVNRLNRQMGIILRRHCDKDTLNYDFHARSFKSLVGFEFNMKSQLKEQLWTLPETRLLNGKLRVTLPQIDIKKDLYFPDNANSCTVFLNIQCSALKDKYEKIPSYEMSPILEISKEDTHTIAQEWTFDVPEGCYCITSIALNYHYKWPRYQLSVNSPEMSPAMICDFSVNPGTFAGKPDKTWWEGQFYFEDKAPKPAKTKAKKNSYIVLSDDDIQAGAEQTKNTSSAPQPEAAPYCLSAALDGNNPFLTFTSAGKHSGPAATTNAASGQTADPQGQEPELITNNVQSPTTQEHNQTRSSPKPAPVSPFFLAKNISIKTSNPKQPDQKLPANHKDQSQHSEEDG